MPPSAERLRLPTSRRQVHIYKYCCPIKFRKRNNPKSVVIRKRQEASSNDDRFGIKGVTTAKIKSDQSVATLGKVSRFYDVTVSKEYETDGGLTSDERKLMEQLLTSNDARMPYGEALKYETDFYAMMPILITDYTSEISDGDEKLNSVKFAWRYADNRPMVTMPETPGIFNDKFNPVYT